MRRAFANRVDATETGEFPMWGKRRLSRLVPCGVCAALFRQYPSGRPKFCSMGCAYAAAAKRFSKQVMRACLHCGTEFKTITSPSRAIEKRDRYCSKQCGCMARRKHWHEPCAKCGNPVRITPFLKANSGRRFCSRECYARWERDRMRRAPRKDNNHDAIAELFEKSGFLVVDTSGAGNGVPDLMLAYRGVVKLVEIKNLKTTYGRKGLNKFQKKLIEERGLPVSVISTIEQAIEFVTRIKACNTEYQIHSVLYRDGAFLTEEQIEKWHPTPKAIA